MNFQNANDSYYFTLDGYGLLKVTGDGAAKLLQGQLTIDMESLSPGLGGMSAHCNPQGRIISLFYIFNVAQSYYLAMPQSLLTIAMLALKKYAPFYQAQLEDVTGSFFILGTLNNTAPLNELAACALPESARSICLVESAPAKSLLPYYDWLFFDTQESIPSIYPETSGRFLPHDLNLPQLGAVSFTKGCYTGQEIIARMHYRGKPKNHLYRGSSAEILEPGTEIFFEKQTAGTIIVCCEKMYNEHYPLLFVASETLVAANGLHTEHGLFIELQKSE